MLYLNGKASPIHRVTGVTSYTHVTMFLGWWACLIGCNTAAISDCKLLQYLAISDFAEAGNRIAPPGACFYGAGLLKPILTNSGHFSHPTIQ